jgi:four helix bundle protein
MSRFSETMAERFLVFIVSILKMERWLCKSFSGRHVYGHLFRAATSAGANYEEARAGESRADFVHKMQIVLKELREAHFWIRLISTGGFAESNDEVITFLLSESKELANITAKSILTAKSSKFQKPG